jgi:formamidopyrimidine-DNA glycosylase
MPELPEVEIFKRRLDATCLGRTISGASIRDRRIIGKSSPAQLVGRLKGARLIASRRHGKYLLVALGKVGWIVMHFGMNGSLQHFRKDDEDPAYDRLRLDFGDDHHLAYVNPRLIGRVDLVADADAFVAKEKLGPDVLDARLGPTEFAQAVAARKRDIKSVLMDQMVVAGIGNIYSDEILFQARLHPRMRADRLDRGELKRLFTKTGSVLRTAVRRGGGSEQMLERLPRGFLIRERKKGGRCPRCGGAIAAIKFSGRTAYYCPHCQPAPR